MYNSTYITAIVYVLILFLIVVDTVLIEYQVFFDSVWVTDRMRTLVNVWGLQNDEALRG